MTASQIDLISKVRSLKIMFTAAECDMIPPEVKILVQNMTRELVDTMHKSSIFYVEDKQIWRTTVYVEPEEGDGTKKKRRFISARTKSELYGKLYEFYIGPGTLADIHDKWTQQRSQENLAPKTLKREKQRWDKYISGSELEKKRIDEIDNFTIEAYIRDIILKHSVTVKELKEIMFLFRGTFKYAFRHRYISANPMQNVEVNTTGCAPAKKKVIESRIYLPDEITAMQHQIDVELRNIPQNSTALAIRFLFLSGIRVGECVALCKRDFNFESKTVHIQRMEQEDENGRREIVEHTKKKSETGDRIIAIGQAGIDLINQVLAINKKYGFHDEDYIFLGEKGRRIHIRAIDNRIRKLCRRANILPEKSAHDIRRTVATTLYRNTHDIELVRIFLGHSDVNTTWSYIVLIDQKEKDNERVVDALSCLFAPSRAADSKVIDFPSSEANRGKISGVTAAATGITVAADAPSATGATAVQQNQGNKKPGNPHKYGISGA